MLRALLAEGQKARLDLPKYAGRLSTALSNKTTTTAPPDDENASSNTGTAHPNNPNLSNVLAAVDAALAAPKEQKAASERLLHALAACAGAWLSEPGTPAAAHGEAVLGHLAARLGAADATVRQRACAAVAAAAASTSAELPAALFGTLRAAVLPRLHDKVASVRAAAAKACLLLQEPPTCADDPLRRRLAERAASDASAAVRAEATRAVALDVASLPLLLDRARDVHASVRAVALARLGTDVDPRRLTRAQRVAVLDGGHRDRAEAVAAAADAMAAMWATGAACQGDLVALAALLLGDAAAAGSAAERAAEAAVAAALDAHGFSGGAVTVPSGGGALGADAAAAAAALAARVAAKAAAASGVSAADADRASAAALPEAPSLAQALRAALAAEPDAPGALTAAHQLLKLAVCVAGSGHADETGVRALERAMLDALRSPETCDAIVDALLRAVRALRRVSGGDPDAGDEALVDLALALVGEDGTEAEAEAENENAEGRARALMVLGSLAGSAAGAPLQRALDAIPPLALQAIASAEEADRELACWALGRRGLLSRATARDAGPILLRAAEAAAEAEAVRGRALQALSDASLLFGAGAVLDSDADGPESLARALLGALGGEGDVGSPLACLAAEAAAKLLLAGRVPPAALTVRLFAMFFEADSHAADGEAGAGEDDDVDADVSENKSYTAARLQQFLAVFFPAAAAGGGAAAAALADVPRAAFRARAGGAPAPPPGLLAGYLCAVTAAGTDAAVATTMRWRVAEALCYELVAAGADGGDACVEFALALATVPPPEGDDSACKLLAELAARAEAAVPKRGAPVKALRKFASNCAAADATPDVPLGPEKRCFMCDAGHFPETCKDPETVGDAAAAPAAAKPSRSAKAKAKAKIVEKPSEGESESGSESESDGGEEAKRAPFLTEGDENIGKRVAKTFDGHGALPGTVSGWLPAEENDGVAYWHVVYDDGDEEDFEAAEVEAGKALYAADFE